MESRLGSCTTAAAVEEHVEKVPRLSTALSSGQVCTGWKVCTGVCSPGSLRCVSHFCISSGVSKLLVVL